MHILDMSRKFSENSLYILIFGVFLLTSKLIGAINALFLVIAAFIDAVVTPSAVSTWNFWINTLYLAVGRLSNP